MRSIFARDIKRSIGVALALLNDEKSLFRRLLVPMLQINTEDFLDLRFLGEFVILEHLSKDCHGEGVIITDPVSLTHLESILDAAKKEIRENGFFSEDQKQSLERKFEMRAINSKASTKDRMRSFIEDFGSEFEEYIKDVNNWNGLRNKGIAHGASLASNVCASDDDSRCKKRLHDLLCDLLYRGFKYHMNTPSKTETLAL